MKSLEHFAEKFPRKAAMVIAETGQTTTYAELHGRSARLAAFLAGRLKEGEVIALLLGNRLDYIDVCFGARRAGLYYVPISIHLKAAEIEHILRDSGAAVVFTETEFAPLLASLDTAVLAGLQVICVNDEAQASDTAGSVYSVYSDIVSQGPEPALPQRATGLDFAYSSGTTGRPKGIKQALRGDAQLAQLVHGAGWVSFFDLQADSVYLSPAPLYHAAPLRFSIRCLANGGTVVVMQKFDAERALAAIQSHRVTHSQWVPTMFARLLSLPPEVRQSHDLSSHRLALHAAAPCPVELKHRMMAWWGPIIWEYYTSSERAGATAISPQEWLAHPGSVGRAVLGRLHIVGDDGEACQPGVDGLVCFEGGPRFQYHNDVAKTAEAHTPQGWATFGDIGHVDADGYLFLTDRRANMIISGGVNIYPQEAENVLLEHPLVKDVAVIGVPHDDFGEAVKAVVELVDPRVASDDTAGLLMAYCRDRLSSIKCPRSVDFALDLPRTETGKLMKRLIRDQYRDQYRDQHHDQHRALQTTASRPPGTEPAPTTH